MNEQFLLSVGATHPWNIAGLGIASRVAYDFRLRHSVVVVGVTAQDERAFHGAFALPPQAVRAQFATTPAYAAAHVGLLFDAANVREVAQFFQTSHHAPLVVDPVFGDTFGSKFSDDKTFCAFREVMVPLKSILTPNLPEAERLLERDIATVDAMLDAARELQALGPHAVLLKGGHLRGDPVDVLATSESVEVFGDARLPGELRGTGDTLAAALACELARGISLVEAVAAARDYVRRKISATLS